VDVDHRLFLLERDVGDVLAVGRPGGRDDRLGRLQDRLLAEAVGVGDLQLVGVAASPRTISVENTPFSPVSRRRNGDAVPVVRSIARHRSVTSRGAPFDRVVTRKRAEFSSPSHHR
jgi:hypothetical protein